MDNIFVERLWRSLKYEEVYLNACASLAEAKAGIGSWLDFYNQERQHQSLGYRTPRQVYEAECPWICDDRRCRPAAPSPISPPAQPPTTGLMLTRRNSSNATTVATSAIGAGTELGRATP